MGRRFRIRSYASKGTQFPYSDYYVLWSENLDVYGDPILHVSLSDDTPKVIKSSKLCREIPKNQNSYTCFFTGVECFIGPETVFNGWLKFPWKASKEHLLSRLHHAEHYANDWSRTNFVFSGYRINYELGHIPASVKILFRRFLQNISYDRTDTMNHNGTFDRVFVHMLDFEKSFTLHGKYPWHPSSYSLVSHRRAAQEFLDKINNMDREFFEQLTMENRFNYFDNAVLPIETFC